jgi:Uma2 family endonuclease
MYFALRLSELCHAPRPAHNDSMSGVEVSQQRLTVEEYSNLPEVIGFKDELIEGERVLTALPKFPHTVVLDNVESILRKQFPDKRVVRETGWQFTTASGVDSVPGPDLMVLTSEDYDHTAQSGGYFAGRPLFVIEVISLSERKFRRLQKAGLYLEAGAGAVVEIIYAKRTVLVYRPEEEAAELIKDRITWPFTASLPDIFARI